MKRKSLLILILISVFSVFFLINMGNNDAFAEDESTEEQLEDTVEENVDKLDLSEFEKFIESLSDEEKDVSFSGALKEFIMGLTKGDFGNASFGTYMSGLCKAAVNDIFGFLPALISIFIISVFGSIMSSMSSEFMKKETSEIIYYVCYAAVIIILLTAMLPLISATKTTVLRIKEFAEIIFPVLLTLMVALGGTVSSSVYQPLMAVFSTVIINIIVAIIIPAFIASVVFSIVGNLSKSIKLTKTTAFIKSGAEWIMGTVFSVFGAFVSMQGITGATADTMTVSAAKFALSSYIPVLGGYVSDGFDLVVASCIVIKNAVGVTGIIVLLSIILYPVLKLVVFLLGLKLTAALSEPLGDGRISELLNSVSKNIVILISALIGLGFVFYLLLMLVIYSCNFGVV